MRLNNPDSYLSLYEKAINAGRAFLDHIEEPRDSGVYLVHLGRFRDALAACEPPTTPDPTFPKPNDARSDQHTVKDITCPKCGGCGCALHYEGREIATHNIVIHSGKCWECGGFGVIRFVDARSSKEEAR